MYRVDNSSDQQKYIQKQCGLIEDLFNILLPKKIEVGNNICRFIIQLTSNKDLDGTVQEVGLCQDCYVFCDYNKLLGLGNFERKQVLLSLFVKGIKLCCHARNCSSKPFEAIEQKVLADGIVFNGFYKDIKVSPNKRQSAQLRGYLSEDIKHISLVLFDKDHLTSRIFLIGEFDFRSFDRLKWISSEMINIYQINWIRSYKSKKVAEDYFAVDVKTGNITYVPVTREAVFDYGVKLLTESNEYERALAVIQQAKELGHGKADNILRHLKTNPEQRDKAVLLQTPKRK
ncbi:hypothetical protein GCM10011383_23770 [Hymenobacter cavernae]|uniref:Uncharacterized protein n=2 Tax=Hymenobacter cavernae TaxID=2044852 RepID=A0ABQ1U740_9BACT|nr:hypothetical protein GCM10011383_23770 [Hymenobacter cavernae]